MKKTIVAFASVAMLVCASSAANATLVAYWNFNTFDPATATVIPADAGIGTVDLSGWEGGVANFAGNSTNALFGDPAGASLSLQGGVGGTGDVTGNGTYIEVQFSMAGLHTLDISYWTRRTGTGFDANQWSYSTDGITFTDFGPVLDPNATTSGELVVLSAPAALDNAPTAFLRYTLDGATSAAGNNRIDNLQLNAIPEPAGIVLMLVGLTGIAMRRRH